jgi:hypothetical protein
MEKYIYKIEGVTRSMRNSASEWVRKMMLEGRNVSRKLCIIDPRDEGIPWVYTGFNIFWKI